MYSIMPMNYRTTGTGIRKCRKILSRRGRPLMLLYLLLLLPLHVAMVGTQVPGTGSDSSKI